MNTKELQLPKISKRRILLLTTIIFAVLASSSLIVYGALINANSIFGPPSGPTTTSPSTSPAPTATPTASPSPTPVVFSGTLSAVTWNTTNPAQTKVGDKLQLKTTLSSTPSTPQQVWFYYSNTPITVGAKNLPTDPTQLIGIDIATSAGTSATVAFTLPDVGTYYFIAEIPNPI